MTDKHIVIGVGIIAMIVIIGIYVYYMAESNRIYREKMDTLGR